jgi:cell division protein FtsL
MTSRLIISSPRFRRTWQIPYNRATLTVLVSALITAFLIVLAVRTTFPPPISDSEYARLEAENRALTIEYKNLTFKMKKLDADTSRMEEHSARILAQLEPDKQ